ncbi:MAG: hypothetical protein ACREQL_12335 [Candidatus Binatia bacterium]
MSPLLLMGAALVGIAVGVLLVVMAIRRLVQVAREPELARAALEPEQIVTFAEPGPVELAIEGPFLTSHFRGLSFEMRDPLGAAVALRRIWFRTQRGGFGRSRLSIERFVVATPGPHRLRIEGLIAGTDYARCAVAFVRPRGGALAATIVALLAAVSLTAACIAVVAVLLIPEHVAAPARPASPSPVAPPTAAPPNASASGGRALASDARRLEGAQEVVWPLLEMHVRVPADWIVRTVTSTELDVRHPTTPSTYVVGHATPMPAGPSAAEYLRVHVEHAKEQLAAGRIEGYATRTFSNLPGVLTIEHRQDGAARMLTWTGFQPAEIGTVSVTVLVGAAGPDFERDEALLGAIVESIRFE